MISSGMRVDARSAVLFVGRYGRKDLLGARCSSRPDRDPLLEERELAVAVADQVDKSVARSAR